MTRVAAIDCGTNSIRLLVADGRIGEDGRPHLSDLTRQMRIVRLGQGVDARGYLDPAAIERTVEATVEYQRMIEALGATSTRFVATSATRDASNSADFVRQIKAVIGVEPEVVVGTEEASLSFNGAVSGLGESVTAPMLVVDIGGGSTELVLGSTRVEQAISIDMGAVRVTEKFFSHVDPAGGVPLQDQERAIAWIDEQLDGAEKSVDLARVRSLVGVAGTVTTLTAQALGLTSYQPERAPERGTVRGGRSLHGRSADVREGFPGLHARGARGRHRGWRAHLEPHRHARSGARRGRRAPDRADRHLRARHPRRHRTGDDLTELEANASLP